MKYKLCLFDFDYTLADATNPIVECFRHTFKEKNIEGFDREKAIKTIGMTLDDAFPALTGIKDEEKIKELVKIYRAKSDEITIQNTRPRSEYFPSNKSSQTSNTLIIRFTFVNGLSAV